MNPVDLLEICRAAGLSVTLDGDDIVAAPRDRLTDDIRAAVRENKSALVAELRLEQFREHVWQALQARPGKVKYFEILDPEADPVRLVLAIRDVGTCDLLIAAGKWDPVRFLELLDTEREAVN